jgi:hypothetical protein
MAKDKRDLLEVLKFELDFLEQGGYGRLPREAWRSRLIFEDSPTCPNFNSTAQIPCEDCVLAPLFSKDALDQNVPCDHIPLTTSGDTLESLYRTGTQREIEDAVRIWLKAAIRKLEAQKAQEAAKQSV